MLLNTVKVAVLVVAMAPVAAAAQDTSQLSAGRVVRAVLADGTEVTGKILTISSSAVDLKLTDGTHLVPLATVRRIVADDSLLNGAIIGAVPGALMGGLFAAIDSSLTHCLLAPDPCSYDTTKDVVKGAVLGAAIGGAIGAGIDSLLTRVLYRGGTQATELSIRPDVSRGRAGAQLSLRW